MRQKFVATNLFEGIFLAILFEIIAFLIGGVAWMLIKHWMK
jgi:hypothetical protein